MSLWEDLDEMKGNLDMEVNILEKRMRSIDLAKATESQIRSALEDLVEKAVLSRVHRQLSMIMKKEEKREWCLERDTEIAEERV